MVYINAKKPSVRAEIKTKKLLDEEIEKKHTVFQKASSEVEQLKSEYSILLAGVSSLRVEKGDLSKEVSSLRAERLSLREETLRFEVEHNQRIVGHSVDIVKKVKRKNELETEIGSLLAKKSEIELNVGFLAKNRDILRSLENDIKEMSDEKERFLNWYSEKNEEIEKNKIEVSQLIEKNGKILIDTEKNLGILDIYIKRLQGYYDHAKININILEQFNIKNK